MCVIFLNLYPNIMLLILSKKLIYIGIKFKYNKLMGVVYE